MKRSLASVVLGLALALLTDRTGLAQQPAKPQPTAEQIQPGLAVGYATGYIQRLAEVRSPSRRDAPPLPKLDYVGDGKVLTSDYTEGVGADIEGFIKLDAPGTWKFQVSSN